VGGALARRAKQSKLHLPAARDEEPRASHIILPPPPQREMETAERVQGRGFFGEIAARAFERAEKKRGTDPIGAKDEYILAADSFTVAGNIEKGKRAVECYKSAAEAWMGAYGISPGERIFCRSAGDVMQLAARSELTVILFGEGGCFIKAAEDFEMAAKLYDISGYVSLCRIATMKKAICLAQEILGAGNRDTEEIEKELRQSLTNIQYPGANEIVTQDEIRRAADKLVCTLGDLNGRFP
jgi:hypothetical protein